MLLNGMMQVHLERPYWENLIVIYFFFYLFGMAVFINWISLLALTQRIVNLYLKFKPLLSLIPYILEKTVSVHWMLSPNANSLINDLMQRLFLGHAEVSQWNVVWLRKPKVGKNYIRDHHLETNLWSFGLDFWTMNCFTGYCKYVCKSINKMTFPISCFLFKLMWFHNSSWHSLQRRYLKG